MLSKCQQVQGFFLKREKKKKKDAQPFYLEHKMTSTYHIAKQEKYFSDQLDMLKHLK